MLPEINIFYINGQTKGSFFTSNDKNSRQKTEKSVKTAPLSQKQGKNHRHHHQTRKNASVLPVLIWRQLPTRKRRSSSRKYSEINIQHSRDKNARNLKFPHNRNIIQEKEKSQSTLRLALILCCLQEATLFTNLT